MAQDHPRLARTKTEFNMNDHLVPSHLEFQSRFEGLLSRMPRDAFRTSEFINLASDRAPWLDTGIDLAAGEHVTAFAMGKT
jgi:hypothetical protein